VNGHNKKVNPARGKKKTEAAEIQEKEIYGHRKEGRTRCKNLEDGELKKGG